MSNLWMGWIFAVVLSAIGFALCWACLEFGAHVAVPVALGQAIPPFSVVLALRAIPGRILTRAAALPTPRTPRINPRHRAGEKSQQIQSGGT